ncbi:MAG: ATP-binding protein [Paludibacter sp.]
MINNYFQRKIDIELLAWAKSQNRKTLLVRGARQVGKSSAIRELGKTFKHFVEVNFDEEEVLRHLFEESLSPQEICQRLSFYFQTPITAGETLLFFDEIQQCKPALSKLRYFYEKFPDLHLVVAGSLLEFAIEDIPSIGVGRERSIFMYPFSFEEFLMATGNNMLVEAYRMSAPSKPLFEPIHNKILNLLKVFLIIGGMPEVVSEFVKTQDILRCQEILNDLVISFRDDFSKYKKKIPALRITEVFDSVARQSEGKFIYEKAAVGLNNAQVKQVLELLIMAGLVYPVTHTAANGIPLGAEINPKYRKMILCDTGLFQRVLGLDTTHLMLSNDFKTVNRGAIAEIFVGLELLKSASCYDPKQLYCWAKEKNIGNAQVDYIVQVGENIYPVEVKSGSQGAMQSLRIFINEKKIAKGIRTSLENFCSYDDIDVYPLYAISNILINKE